MNEKLLKAFPEWELMSQRQRDIAQRAFDAGAGRDPTPTDLRKEHNQRVWEAVNIATEEVRGFTLEHSLAEGRERIYVDTNRMGFLILSQFVRASESELQHLTGNHKHRCTIRYHIAEAKELLRYTEFKEPYDAIRARMIELLKESGDYEEEQRGDDSMEGGQQDDGR